jgi:hypothetical protein
MLDRLLERPDDFPLSDDKRTTVTKARDRLKEIVERGQVTVEERSWLVKTARYLMVSVF